MVETFQAGVKPTFVETLDAVEVAKTSGMPLAPVMIYGDDVTHVLTEEGIAYLYRAESLEERRAMVAAVAGDHRYRPLVWDAKRVAALRQSGKVVYPEDLGIRRSDATRSPAGRRQRRRAGGVVRRTVQPTGKIPELVMKNLSPLHAESRGQLAGAYRQRLSD
ncbi:bifunctional putative acetyl-CoA:acetoacetyl-CoA transferase: alpha subunit/beta subunit [Klebsiella pneumoniae]|uniref:Bifunctional putative acetyl-CoA:acetoacetyl-CoA transferase: alpha subunit/beta subunit n=1 Tax=Klebsiella pneumoniae TaxID=573 RepID=A0A3S4HMS4_KLEPN|nr:bifunctional putative acetyl-CoA:acetoacetyl-CoA transferase: alpha subunit/beta subunit [Klebsiella pneumoniae]